MTRKNLCACLAVYDWAGNINTVQFHQFAGDFFSANGVSPNVCGITHPNGDSEAADYAATEDRLRSHPLPQTDGLSLYHTLPNYAQLVFGWDVMAGISLVAGKTLLFCCDPTIRGIGLDCFVPVLERISAMVEVRYGIGYLRSFEFGPSVYAAGMVTGLGYNDEDMLEADRIGSWFHERMQGNRHLLGYLRDVYPLNVLSEPHLSQRVACLPLADWIGQRPERGILRQLAGGALLWRIDERNVETVRAELISTGLLIAYPPSG